MGNGADWRELLQPAQPTSKYNELAYKHTRGVIIPPFSAVLGNNAQVADFVNNIIDFHYPEVTSIFDPTCGEVNYQFAPYLFPDPETGGYRYYLKMSHRYVRYIASDLKETRWNCVNGECLKWDFIHDDPPPNLRADIFLYDPPYIPQATDNRAEQYGINDFVSVERIRTYYSRFVFEKLASITNVGGIVKGADFYYPTTSDSFHGFLTDILDVKGLYDSGFRITGILIYRYFNRLTGKMRFRLARSMAKRGYRRPSITHTYFVLLRKYIV